MAVRCHLELMSLEFVQSYLASRKPGAVALTVESVPRRIVPELRHFHWLLKMNNQ